MTDNKRSKALAYPGEQDKTDDEKVEHNAFDWQSIRAVCIGTMRQHPAYGMSFEEYAKRRGEFTDDDGQPPVSLTFRLPPYPAFVIPSFARRRRAQTGESLYRYLGLVLEMGLIKFQHEYHDTYSAINAITDVMAVSSPEQFEEHKWICMKLGSDKLSLGLSSRENTKMTPHVGYWLSSAIKQLCSDLKMTQGDLVTLCVYIGIIEEAKTMPIPEKVLAEFKDTVRKFDLYLRSKYLTATQAKSNFVVSADVQTLVQ